MSFFLSFVMGAVWSRCSVNAESLICLSGMCVFVCTCVCVCVQVDMGVVSLQVPLPWG